MAKFNLLNRALLALAIGALILVSALLATMPVQASDPKQSTEDYCLSCHKNPDLSMTLPSGETLSLYVSPEVLSQSAHSPLGIECETCHTTIKTYPHPALQVKTKRELSRSYYLSCQKCHSQNYEKTLDSMHARSANAGNLDAPVCTDCHGAHNVRQWTDPETNTLLPEAKLEIINCRVRAIGKVSNVQLFEKKIQGKKSKAALYLNINRTTLIEKMKRLKLDDQLVSKS